MKAQIPLPMHEELDMSNRSSRVETWWGKWNLGFTETQTDITATMCLCLYCTYVVHDAFWFLGVFTVLRVQIYNKSITTSAHRGDTTDLLPSEQHRILPLAWNY